MFVRLQVELKIKYELSIDDENWYEDKKNHMLTFSDFEKFLFEDSITSKKERLKSIKKLLTKKALK